MKKTEPELDDELRPEYNLRELRVHRLGPDRTSFGGIIRSESEEETAYLLSNENMRRRLLDARKRDEGISLEDAREKLGI
jgi:hypothetical protein